MLDPIEANIHILYTLRTSGNPMVGDGEREHWLRTSNEALYFYRSQAQMSLIQMNCHYC